MKLLFKKILPPVICASLLATTTTIFAVLPPKYLEVENFAQCLANKNMGTWTSWCMPATKPDTCSDESWQQLNNLTGKDRVPAC